MQEPVMPGCPLLNFWPGVATPNHYYAGRGKGKEKRERRGLQGSSPQGWSLRGSGRPEYPDWPATGELLWRHSQGGERPEDRGASRSEPGRDVRGSKRVNSCRISHALAFGHGPVSGERGNLRA